MGCACTQIAGSDLTLETARVGLGKKEFCVGLTFVALSRVKALSGLGIVDAVDFSRVRKLGGRTLDERKLDFIRRYGR